MLVFVETTLDRTTENILEDFRKAVRDQPEIMECHLVAGGFDYLPAARGRHGGLPPGGRPRAVARCPA
jgi:Lrp/AsnC family leucine-responsive transcriptional regulator